MPAIDLAGKLSQEKEEGVSEVLTAFDTLVENKIKASSFKKSIKRCSGFIAVF